MSASIQEIPTDQPGIMLRQLTPKDDEVFLASVLANPDHLARFGGHIISAFQSSEDVKWARETAKHRGDLRLGIWQQDEYGSHFAGGISTCLDERGDPEISYWVDAAHTRCGIGTAAVRATTQHLLGIYSRVYASVAAENEASIRVLEHAGFTFEDKACRDGYPAYVHER